MAGITMDKQPPRHSLTASFSSSVSFIFHSALTRITDKLAPSEGARTNAGRRFVHNLLAAALKDVPVPRGRPPGSGPHQAADQMLLDEIIAIMETGKTFRQAVNVVADSKQLLGPDDDINSLERRLRRQLEKRRSLGH